MTLIERLTLLILMVPQFVRIGASLFFEFLLKSAVKWLFQSHKFSAKCKGKGIFRENNHPWHKVPFRMSFSNNLNLLRGAIKHSKKTYPRSWTLDGLKNNWNKRRAELFQAHLLLLGSKSMCRTLCDLQLHKECKSKLGWAQFGLS